MSGPTPGPRPDAPQPDYARRQAVGLAALVLVGLAVWGLVSLLDGSSGSRSGGHTAAVSAPRGSLLDALAPELQQSTGGAIGATHATLGLGQAVAQVFLVGFAGTDAHAPFFTSLKDHDWGGVVLDSGNVTDTHQLRSLAGALDRAAAAAGHTPPLIGVRQAGGAQSALAGLPPPAQRDQGATPAAVQAQALAAAGVLRSLGLNLNLAPSADLAYQGALGASQAFAADPGLVGRLTVAALAGYRRERVIAAVGHFPGEGSASQDPQVGQATVGLSSSELEARDLQPFAAAARVAPAMQVSDALFAGLDPAVPASLSPTSYALLRRRLHYTGVAVSGDLSAAALDGGTSVAAAAVAALKAGADLLYVPDAADQEPAYDAVLMGVRDGQIPPKQLLTAAARVLALKRAYGLLG